MRTIIPSKMAEYTGLYKGTLDEPCTRCHDDSEGERWEHFIRERKSNGHGSTRYMGEICLNCYNEINQE